MAHAPLAFIVTGAGTDGVHISPVALHLGMDAGIAIDLGGRGLEDLCLQPFGKSQHVDGPMYVHFCCLDRVILVMDWGSGTGEIKDFIDLDVKRKRDVVPYKFEIRVVQQVNNISLCTGIKIIHTENIGSILQKIIAEMGADKARPSCHKNTNVVFVFQGCLTPSLAMVIELFPE